MRKVKVVESVNKDVGGGSNAFSIRLSPSVVKFQDVISLGKYMLFCIHAPSSSSDDRFVFRLWTNNINEYVPAGVIEKGAEFVIEEPGEERSF